MSIRNDKVTDIALYNYERSMEKFKSVVRINDKFLKKKSKMVLSSPKTYVYIHNSSMRFSNLPKERNKVYMGFEWEVFWKGQKVEDSHPQFKTIVNTKLCEYMNARHDAGDVELVSVPATLNFHKQFLEKYFVKSVCYRKINKDTKNDSYLAVGIHVHIDQKAFTDTSMKKFITFFACAVNEQFLNFIAQRPINSRSYNRDITNLIYPNDITKPILPAIFSLTKSQTTKVWERVNKSPYLTSKSNIINLSSGKPTIEVRMFKTTKHIEDLYKNLEFCDALCRYSRVSSYSNLKHTEFIKYVNKRKEKYPFLTKFLKKF